MTPERETRPSDYDNSSRVLALVQRCRDDAARNTPRLERDKQDLLNLLTWRGGAAAGL